MVFSDEDLMGVKTVHDDIIVISTIMTNIEVHKTMVDSASATNALFHNAFN